MHVTISRGQQHVHGSQFTKLSLIFDVLYRLQHYSASIKQSLEVKVFIVGGFRDVKQLKETQPDAFDVLKNFPVKFQDEATADAFGEYSISYAHPVIKYVADFDLCCNITYYFLHATRMSTIMS